nr:metallophosphoesterase [Oleiagrimonas sp. C23AA]
MLQISDTHFGTERPQAVEALLRLARDLKPDVVVISGDITQRARRDQFRAAGHFVERLPESARVIVPGNHDIPLYNLYARLSQPYAGYRRVFGRDLEPVWESDDMLVVGLNTTRYYRHKDGEISASQVGRVCAMLAESPESQLRVVVTHQPMHVIRPTDEANLLHGAEEAAYALVGAGVDVLMGGHIHLPYARPLRERYPELPRDAWVVQAGTAVSHRLRGDISNSVNTISYDARMRPLNFLSRRWDYDQANDAFVEAERRLIDLDRGGVAHHPAEARSA